MSNDELKSNIDEQPISLAEHLSSVLDDEAASFEQRRVLDELALGDKSSGSSISNSKIALSQKLSHFALIGESMRSTNPAIIAGPSFLAGIHEQIALEDEYHDVQVSSSTSANDVTMSQSGLQNSWLRPVGGFALVASFAAIAVMGLQNYQLNNQLTEQSKTIIAAQTPVKEAQTVEVAPSVDAVSIANIDNKNLDKAKTDAKSQEQEYRQANVHARSFLKRYVDSHVQYASRSTFVPSVRVIAYADY